MADILRIGKINLRVLRRFYSNYPPVSRLNAS